MKRSSVVWYHTRSRERPVLLSSLGHCAVPPISIHEVSLNPVYILTLSLDQLWVLSTQMDRSVTMVHTLCAVLTHRFAITYTVNQVVESSPNTSEEINSHS
jgi:hypothetical protein